MIYDLIINRKKYQLETQVVLHKIYLKKML
jgi:hypothetical protein